MVENWLPVYRDRNKEVEAWACVDGSDLQCENTHEEGPPNELFRQSGSKVATTVGIEFIGRLPVSRDPNYEYMGKGRWRYTPQKANIEHFEAIHNG